MNYDDFINTPIGDKYIYKNINRGNNMGQIIKKHFTVSKIWNFVVFKKLWFDGNDFSMRKFFASIFAGLAIYEKVEAVFFPLNHFSVKMSQNGVSDTIIVTIIASLDVLSLGALAIYGWSNGGKQIFNGAAATTATATPPEQDQGANRAA